MEQSDDYISGELLGWCPHCKNPIREGEDDIRQCKKGWYHLSCIEEKHDNKKELRFNRKE